MGALADCERVSAGLLGQPVNTITTLGFVVAGLLVARYPRLRWAGAGLVATGVGSFLFHGPMPAGSQWAHDVSLVWLVLLAAGLGSSWERWTRLPGLVGIGVLLALLPGLADPLAAGLVVAAVAFQVQRERRATIVAMLVLGAVAIFGRLGSTGGPLCDPDSIFQLHGVWHLGAAAVVALWVVRLGGIGSGE